MTTVRDTEIQNTLVCDLHTHSFYSPDCLTSPAAFLETCRRKGLDRVAVTDHDTIAGALKLKEMASEQIIVGQEIHTTQGELIALFLSELIPAHRTPQETIELVHAQGGIAGVSHPLDRLRREAMRRDALQPLLDQLDFMEVFNARCMFPADNHAARTLAVESGLLMTAGSDAHSRWELGRGTVIMPHFDSSASFLESLRSAQIRGRLSPFWIHFVSTYAKIARKAGWAPMPA